LSNPYVTRLKKLECDLQVAPQAESLHSSKRPMNLTNKTIFITGAAHGLGRELSLLLDGLGGSLLLVDRDAPGLDSLAAALTHPSRTLPCDLADFASRKRLIESAGLVDVLVNCAGMGSHSTLAQMSVDEVERVMQVNALAPLELIAGLAPLELVVNIGSVAGEMNLPSVALYAAGKSAVHAFTRGIALEGTRTLLVILGPLGGTDFVHSIAHPRTSQPGWYRGLDLPVSRAARLIVDAMKRGQRELVAPWWYRLVFVAARLFVPLIKLMKNKFNGTRTSADVRGKRK
jgi:short-subunit dehydrogenase